MNIKGSYMLRFLPLLVICLLPIVGSAQFNFSYTGPDTISVGANCKAPLTWPGYPNTPSVTSTVGANILLFAFNQVFTGYNLNDSISAGTTVMVTYAVTDDMGNAANLSFPLYFVDNTPPFFVNVPADITYSCGVSLPAIPSVTVDDNCDPIFPITVSGSQFNIINPTVCGGGQIARYWTYTHSNGMTIADTQMITIQSDVLGPVFGVSPKRDTVTCLNSDFFAWRNQELIDLSNALSDACAGGSTLIAEIQAGSDTLCGTTAVKYTATDVCGNTTIRTGYYVVQDTIAPTFQGTPSDAVLSCSQAIPAAAMVTATDDCDPMPAVVFVETSTQSGAGCTQFDYTIKRKWTATDRCGNENVFEQVITVNDDRKPSFTLPANASITCGSDTSAMVLGMPTMVQDNCDTSPQVSFADVIINGACPYKYTIQRNWKVQDACLNDSISVQTIQVSDSEAPQWQVPIDRMISCDASIDPTQLGTPTQITDNCDPQPVLSYQDSILVGPCTHTYSLIRKWRVEDACDNVRIHFQRIEVRDTTKPSIVLAAANKTVSCQSGDIDSLFQDWLLTNAGAVASDNCTSVGNLRWEAFATGTNNAAVLPIASCPAMFPSLTRVAVIDFWVYDACDNARITTATFGVVDMDPPTLTCPADGAYLADNNDCQTLIRLVPPAVSDACLDVRQPVSLSQNMAIVATIPANASNSLVESITYTFSVPSAPAYVDASVDFTIELQNVDGEGAQEYFDIFDENGLLLGNTQATSAQCGQSITALQLSPSTFNALASDGSITFTLVPFFDSALPLNNLINPVCNAGTVIASLDYEVVEVNGLVWNYSIDNSPFEIGNIQNFPSVPLEVGQHTVQYSILDCGQNQATCSFNIEIQDLQAPTIVCPLDIEVFTAADACTASVTFPLPLGLQENCRLDSSIVQLPITPITFEFNSDLNDYVSQSIQLQWTVDTIPPIHGDVLVVLNIWADLDGQEGYYELLGEDGTVLGTTLPSSQVSLGDCSTATSLRVYIDNASYATWATDGQLSLQLVPFSAFTTIGLGVGINPCSPGVVSGNGQGDGSSVIEGSLRYALTQYTYFVEGTSYAGIQAFSTSPMPTMVFPKGTRNIGYVSQDFYGNIDTCLFAITVVDRESPVARCQGTIVQIDPSGQSSLSLLPTMINNGSTDNCGIQSMAISPNNITCQQAGQIINATLTVVDSSGNNHTCTAPIRVEAISAQPDYALGACGTDSLYLMAMPPSDVNNFTYQWQGPNGFQSAQPNPIRVNLNASMAGTYSLIITGITGCTSGSTLEVPLSSLPLSPNLYVQDTACAGSTVVFATDPVFNATQVQYQWFVNQMLIAETNTPVYEWPNVIAGTYDIQLKVWKDGCEGPFSEIQLLRVLSGPIATTATTTLTLCEGEILQLMATAPNSGAGITFAWTGPNNYQGTSAQPSVINNLTAIHAGTYQVIASLYGCPGIPATTTVQINVLPSQPTASSNSTPSSPVCEGGNLVLQANTQGGVDSVHWTGPNGLQFTTVTNSLTLNPAPSIAEGTWRVRSYKNGCASPLSQNFSVALADAPQVQATFSPNIICEGSNVTLQGASPNNVSYVWSGPNGYQATGAEPVLSQVNVQDTGRYTVTVTTQLGCKDSAFVNLNIFEPVQPAATVNAVLCKGDTIQLNVNCISGATYEWRGPNGFSSGICNPRILNANGTTHNGTYRVRIRTNNCWSDTAFVQVNVRDLPVTPVLVSNNNICFSTTPITLQVTGSVPSGTTFNWFDGSGVLQSGQSSPSFTVPNSSTYGDGMHPFFVRTTANGCTSASSSIVNVSGNVVPNITASAGPDALVCEGQVFNTQAQAPSVGSGVWSFVSGNAAQWDIANTQQAQTVISALTPNTVYTFQWTLSNGFCTNYSSDQVALTVRPVEMANAGIDIDTCNVNQVVLKASQGVSAPGRWSQPTVQANIGVVIVDPTNPETPITGLNPSNIYIFTWTLDDNGCGAANDNVLVQIGDDMADGGLDKQNCGDDCVTLSANAPLVGAGFWTALNPLNEVQQANDPNSEVCNLVEGNNLFVWTINNGFCGGNSRDTITVAYSEALSLFDDTAQTQPGGLIEIPILDNDVFIGAITVSLTDVGEDGFAQLGENDIVEFIPKPGFIGTAVLKYEVCKENCDCKEASIFIQVAGDLSCDIPSIFTPNDDGMNDTFVIPCLQESQLFPGNELTIYNQWGNEVFQAKPYLNDWSGKFGAEDLPKGTYFYILKLGNGEAPRNGYLILQR